MSEQITIDNWLDYLSLNSYPMDDKTKIIKFIFLWMKYNNWYCQKYKSLNDSKGAVALSEIIEASKAYEENPELKVGFLTSFQKIEKPITENTKNIGQREGIYKDNSEEIEAPYTNGADCLCKFLKVIYKIRCNFFHGSKMPVATNLELIPWAYDCLSALLTELENKKIIDLNNPKT